MAKQAAKRKEQQPMSLFETNERTNQPAEQEQMKAEPYSPPKIKDPCPRCGGRSAKTVRSFEHGGATNYCAGGCLSDDRMDCFYFTPAVETFDEAAEREEAKKIVAEEVPPAAAADYSAFDLNGPEHKQVAEDFKDEIAKVIVERLGLTDLFGQPIAKPQAGALAERFGVPPFSVLDARQGYWKARKAEWVAMGIKSEEGRVGTNTPRICADGETETKQFGRSSPGRVFGQDLMKGENRNFPARKGVLHASETGRTNGEEFDGGDCWAGAGSSIFDPVLTELCYKWFAPAGAKILDPFAGGSVRGIVAQKLGYDYTGIELRPEQVAANEAQALAMKVSPRWVLGDSSKMDSLLPLVDESKDYDQLYDMVFACPPYYDLEVYSESNEDGSAKQSYAEFIAWYEGIFKACVARLKWNRFLVVVVGEIRDEDGFYRNFVGDTVSVMLRCGLKFYNEAVLLTSIGSLPLRVNAQFGGYRKLGKTHQNVLCFYRGSNCEQIAEKFGKLL